MAKIIVTEFVSLDGVMEDPGGAEDFKHGGWTFEIDRGEGDKFKLDETMDTAALLLGRKTYEGFAAAWPSREGEFADKFNNMPKYVVSSTLESPEWNNSTVLKGDDLELLATAAYMLGREDDWMQILERAHQRHLEVGAQLRAARCAIWIGMNLATRGALGPASGWLGRGQRLVERDGSDCAEQGYMLLPVAFQRDSAGDVDGAASTAAAAAEIGERFGDADLSALAAHLEGEFLVHGGRVREGLAALDQAMVAVTAGEVSPVASGIVYCGVILACEDVYELRRAQEWTAALTRWCERQPELRAFTGRCRVHRAQLMRLRGAWPEALEETRRAEERFEDAMNRAAAAKGYYLRAEVHRLRGESRDAEAAYREASRLGLEPQPGLALLRLAQGNADAAAAALRRALAQTDDRL